jgi:hypothetical protein
MSEIRTDRRMVLTEQHKELHDVLYTSPNIIRMIGQAANVTYTGDKKSYNTVSGKVK